MEPPSGTVPELNGGDPLDERRLRFHSKDTEQYHICFGAPGIARADDRRFALGVLDSAFGGSVSSRLFREVREKRGLAYAVGSYSEQYLDRGTVAMYVGTREDNVSEACEIIGRELATLSREGIRGEELERAKEHVKGRMVLGMESSAARMSRAARSILFDTPFLSIDELLARVDAVDEDDVAEFAAELFDPARASRPPASVRTRTASAPQRGRLRSPRRMIRVVVAGAAGRMGAASCEAVDAAEDLELAGRADPALGAELGDAAGGRGRRRRLHDARRGARQRRGPVSKPGCTRSSGTTGFDLEPLREAASRRRRERPSSPPTSRSGRC